MNPPDLPPSEPRTGFVMAEDFQVATIEHLQNREEFVAPRVQVSGKVLYKAAQSDGDVHVVLVDPSVDNSISTLAAINAAGLSFVVCEIIPELPMPNGVPVLHSIITVRGIARWDIEHGWPEVHPILSWSLNG